MKFRFPKQIIHIHIPNIFQSQNIHLNLIFHYTKREHTWQHHMLSHFPIFLSKKNNKRKGGEKQNSKTVYVHIYIRQYSQFLSKTFIKKRFSPTPLDKRKRNKSTATWRASCGPHLSLSLWFYYFSFVWLEKCHV